MNRFVVLLNMVVLLMGICDAQAQKPDEFSQALYYLYSNNMQDEWGEYTDEFLGLQSCGDVRVEASSDLSRLWIKDYAGMEMPGPGLELNRVAGGLYEMPLGQTVYSHEKLGDVILATYNTALKIYDTEGAVEFELQSGALVCLYDNWVYGYAPATGQIFSDLTCKKLAIYRPNATIEYGIDGTDERVSKPVLFETRKGSDGRSIEGFNISGILPMRDGFVARFDAVDLPSGETVYIHDEAPFAPSGYDSAGNRTGYYRLQGVNSVSGSVTNRVAGAYDAGIRQFAWCADCYLMGLTGYDRWQAVTASGKSLGLMTSATVKIDTELGLAEAIASEAETPPEYYNLQGMKVAHPARGQVYIVKTGTRIVKKLVGD